MERENRPTDLEVLVALSRKRKKELKKLRSSAEDLWGRQQDVLERASGVATEASRQAGYLTREQVAPRIKESYDHYLRSGVDSARGAVKTAGSSVQKSVAPAVGTVIGAALPVADVAKDKKVREALKRVNYKSFVAPPKKKGPGFGTFALIGVGVVAVAGVGYAVWQTFRADDELWVADEEPSASASSTPTVTPVADTAVPDTTITESDSSTDKD